MSEISLVIGLIILGHFIDKNSQLTSRYVSPALVGGLVGSLILLIAVVVFKYTWQLPQLFERLLLTAFLFSIGIRIGLVYSWQHIRNMTYLLIIASVFLFILELTIQFGFHTYSKLVLSFGSSTFSWNNEWGLRIQPLFPREQKLWLYFQLSLFLVFLLTPFVLWRLQSFTTLAEVEHKGINIGNWHVLGLGAVVGVSFAAVWLKICYLADVLFLFDFVISMTIGVMVGIMLRRTNNNTHRQFVSTIQDIGLLSLDGFIIIMILNSAYVILAQWSWVIFGLLLTKILIVTLIFVVIVSYWVKDRRRLVLASAVWAFILSSPVTCMNAMRSVVSKHGEADDVLLLVPPVILWLVNYPHYVIFLWLYKLGSSL